MDLTTVIHKNVEAKKNYMFKWVDFIDDHSTRPQLVVSLPPQLRLRQQSPLPARIKFEVVDTNANFRIREASLIHQGFYTAFKIINNTIDGNSYEFIEEKRNFYINVIGIHILYQNLFHLFIFIGIFVSMSFCLNVLGFEYLSLNFNEEQTHIINTLIAINQF